jgi:acetyltransferase-like isoleucine patch superfamily enzyme
MVRVLSVIIPIKTVRHKIRNSLRGKGKNNKLIIVKNGKEYINCYLKVPRGLVISITGNNNVVKLNLPIKAKDSRLTIDSSDGYFEIGSSEQFNGVNIMAMNGVGQNIKIGKNTSILGKVNIHMTYNTSLVIGEDCMFSAGIFIRLTDAHTIFDKNTGEILNKPKHTLVIGDHCWIGQFVKITKNAIIPNNTIVGMDSVVTKEFTEKYTVLAGNPARVVRTGVNWDRSDLTNFEKKQKQKIEQKMTTEKTIFTFWEPKENMPAYLELCIKTWYKFLPDYNIIILDYKTVDEWLGKNHFDESLYRQSPKTSFFFNPY